MCGLLLEEPESGKNFELLEEQSQDSREKGGCMDGPYSQRPAEYEGFEFDDQLGEGEDEAEDRLALSRRDWSTEEELAAQGAKDEAFSLF
mmetsp:Transcript_31352/g.61901  ORF Transcript_31352/g.61901 Transcript_31352/m.61901 type:complete len:90 (-) Transcript_31352:294-563(-)